MAEKQEKESAAIIVKKHRGGHAGHHGGAWKIAFADFTLAMMAFFLLMWILASTTEAEKEAISGYFQNPDAPISGKAPLLLLEMHPLTSPEQMSSNEIGKSSLESFLRNEQEKLNMSDEDVSQAVKDIEDSIKAGLLEVDVATDRIVIRILEDGSFPSGSADLRPEFFPVLKKVGQVLEITPGKVTVSGYTDNVPIQTVIFRSNRELSAVRAVSVAEELLKNKKIESDRFVIHGHGENDAIATNDTNEGRAKNRRVELEIAQGERPAFTGKVITIDKDADTKLLPNIDKIDGDNYSVLPPITEIDFDGNGKYLEQGELGVFDQDFLYNYDLNGKVVKPTAKPTDTTKPDVTEVPQKPDDLGLFKVTASEVAVKKTLGDLGVIKEDDSKPQPAAKELKIELKQAKDDLGLFKEEKTTIEQNHPPDELGLFHATEGDQKANKAANDLGLFEVKASSPIQDKNPDDLGLFKGKEVQDRNDLGIVRPVAPKKATIIKIDKDAGN